MKRWTFLLSAELEKEYQEVRIRGPRAGVPVSTLVISTVRLKRAKRKRRYLRYQMEELEQALP